MEKLKQYLTKKNLKATPWAIENNIAPSVISRLFSGKSISLKNAVKIEKATSGKIRAIDISN